MASSMAAAPATSVTQALRRLRLRQSIGCCLGGRSLGAGKDSVVTGAANGVDQRLGRGDSRIEDHAGAIGDQIDARGFHSGGGAQRFFHMMLAGGAGHAQNWERERFRCGRGHLWFQRAE